MVRINTDDNKAHKAQRSAEPAAFVWSHAAHHDEPCHFWACHSTPGPHNNIMMPFQPTVVLLWCLKKTSAAARWLVSQQSWKPCQRAGLWRPPADWLILHVTRKCWQETQHGNTLWPETDWEWDWHEHRRCRVSSVHSLSINITITWLLVSLRQNQQLQYSSFNFTVLAYKGASECAFHTRWHLSTHLIDVIMSITAKSCRQAMKSFSCSLFIYFWCRRHHQEVVSN